MTPFEYTLAALLTLPVAVEDKANEYKPAQYAAIATEVSRLKPPRGVGSKDWRALVLAVGGAETHYLYRVMDGQCKPFECDRGRARSGWQLQKNKHIEPVWDQLQGMTNIAVQVQTADKMLKLAYYQCAKTPTDVWIRPVVNAFAGRGCQSMTIVPWGGYQKRFTYWLKARQAMG